MIPRLQTIWENLRGSLWAMPLAMICVAAAAALTAVNIRLGQGSDPVWFLYSGGADNAPQFLSHLVTAMITMATLAISITMVVLTLAAQQLGPRLIQNFMRDWHTQASLGLFVSTVVYLLLVLRSSYGFEDRTPNLAVTIGTALVVLSVIVVLVFVHHLARSIIADNVIQAVGGRLDGEIRRLLPEKGTVTAPPFTSHGRQHGAPVRLPAGGYVQALDFHGLMKIACADDLVIELDVRAGHHVVADKVVAWISPSAMASDDVCAHVANCVQIGRERTAVQDLEFSVRHLVEIAVRALSTGINDPYTAMAAIDRLSLAISHVMTRGPAEGTLLDDDAHLRIIAPVSTFEGIVDAAFHQIRQRAEKSPDVLMRLAENLGQLIERADGGQRPALEHHMRLVLAAGRRNIAEDDDLKALEERAAVVMSESGPAGAATGQTRTARADTAKADQA